MQLYDRDYSILDLHEQAVWQSLQEREVTDRIGGGHIRCGSVRDYPKAIRHHIQLFPNNFLDLVELNDQARLHEQLVRFRTLLDSADLTERELCKFIKTESAYFIVASLLSGFRFGHHEAYLFPEVKLGTSHEVDYLLAGKGSGGWEFVFIEFETPDGRVTKRDGDLGDSFRKGMTQVEE